MYKKFIRPLLFKFQPEYIHNLTFLFFRFLTFTKLSNLLFKVFINPLKDRELEQELFGIKFQNPVGLAAGLDKNAEIVDVFSDIGFSHIEIGTVTPKAQAGNDKPRAFRLLEDSALINRMGFNNFGVDKIIQNIKKSRSNIIIGGNIGKNKLTPNNMAVSDYKLALRALYPYVDYFTINVSSPNTPNLRDLQDKKPLKTILSSLKELCLQMETAKPILLKIAPDLSFSQIDEIIEIVKECNIDGIVATNTTISRENLKTDAEKINRIGNGGLSGKPLKTKATEIIRYISKQTHGKIPIIGVGGIMCPEDAIEKIKAGASLIQLYTGFIYEGPGLVKKINKTLLKMYKNEHKNQRN